MVVGGIAAWAWNDILRFPFLLQTKWLACLGNIVSSPGEVQTGPSKIDAAFNVRVPANVQTIDWNVCRRNPKLKLACISVEPKQPSKRGKHLLYLFTASTETSDDFPLELDWERRFWTTVRPSDGVASHFGSFCVLADRFEKPATMNMKAKRFIRRKRPPAITESLFRQAAANPPTDHTL